MQRVYRLASGAVDHYPYGVAVCFDGVPEPVGIGEGGGQGAFGGWYTAADALHPRWADHFKKAGGCWLRPYLERMAAGERVSADEVVAHYTLLHGVEPEWYWTW